MTPNGSLTAAEYHHIFLCLEDYVLLEKTQLLNGIIPFYIKDIKKNKLNLTEEILQKMKARLEEFPSQHKTCCSRF